MEIGQRIEVSIRRVANGYLVNEEKRGGYRSYRAEETFYPEFIDALAAMEDHAVRAEAAAFSPVEEDF